MQRNHCLNSIDVAGGVVGDAPLLEELQRQRKRRGDPAGDHGVAQQGGQVVADRVENAEGQRHQERAVLGEAQGGDVRRLVEAEGGHRGGDARAQAGDAEEHGGGTLGPLPLVVDQGNTDFERAKLDSGLFLTIAAFFKRELFGHEALWDNVGLLGCLGH